MREIGPCCIAVEIDSALDGLALAGNAPKIFTRVNGWGLPWIAVLTNSLFGLLAYMAVSNGAGRVFGWYVPYFASTSN